MVGLDGDGHVVFVDEQAVIGRRNSAGGTSSPRGHVVRRRKQGEQPCTSVPAGLGGKFISDNCIRGGVPAPAGGG